MNERVIKKGSKEWWTHIAIRQATRCREGESAIATVEEVNRQLDILEHSRLKRLWFLLTTGDIYQRDATEAEVEKLQNQGDHGLD